MALTREIEAGCIDGEHAALAAAEADEFVFVDLGERKEKIVGPHAAHEDAAEVVVIGIVEAIELIVAGAPTLGAAGSSEVGEDGGFDGRRRLG